MTTFREILEIRESATEFARMGDIVSAIVLDDIAYNLERGKTWDQLLDDVSVFDAPTVH